MPTTPTAEPRSTGTVCQDCTGWVADDPEGGPGDHPYLFCELVKLGHHDPAAYLAQHGFRRPLNHAPRSGRLSAVRSSAAMPALVKVQLQRGASMVARGAISIGSAT